MSTIKSYKKIFLCGDIGGTNANFSIVGFKNLVKKNKAKLKPDILLMKRYDSSRVTNFSRLVKNFYDYARNELGVTPKEACFAGAGPVESARGNQKIKMTNASFIINAKQIIKSTPLSRVLLKNDFEAISYAINILDRRDYLVVNRGITEKNAAKVVVGAGTGLGMSRLYFNKSKNSYLPLPSEGGHGDLPITTKKELELAEFIRKKRKLEGSVSYEDVLSGRGLEIMYKFFSKRDKLVQVSKRLSAAKIAETRKTDHISKKTFEWFTKFYARACRDFALENLAKGGLYIAGGISSKNPEIFNRQFIRVFTRNATFKDILKKIPIYIITNYNISHLGAAYALIMN